MAELDFEGWRIKQQNHITQYLSQSSQGSLLLPAIIIHHLSRQTPDTWVHLPPHGVSMELGGKLCSSTRLPSINHTPD